MKSEIMRKLLSVLLVVCVAASLCSMAVFAEPEAEEIPANGEEWVEPVEEEPVEEAPAEEKPAGDEPAGEIPTTGEVPEEPAAEEPEAFTATFVGDDGVAGINVYYTKDYTEPSESGVWTAVARDGDTGEVVATGDGQLNFEVILADGYAIDSVTATEGAYKNVKGPGDTGVANMYRLTKVSGDLTVTITTTQDVPEPVDAFYVTYVADEGVERFDLYYTKDISEVSQSYVVAENETIVDIVRDSTTGEAEILGGGQVNFTVVPLEGYVVQDVTVEGTYNKLKGPNDTGKANTYGLTKAASDLTITVTTRELEEGEEYDPNSYTLTSEGIVDGTGNNIGNSLKLKSAGTYTLIGVDLEDYVDSRVQVQAEGITVVLQDVRMSYVNGAVINAKYDTIICVKGDNYMTRIIDLEDDPTDDGGKVIKGEAGTIGEGVSITFIGDGTLNIDAPKKGIGVDVYFGDMVNEEITEVELDATVNFDGPTINIEASHECVEANVVNFNAGEGTFISTGDDGVNVGTDGDDQDEDDTDGDGNVREYMYPNLRRNIDYKSLSINVNGGTWVVNSKADGLDSNGSVRINGGEMQVFSSTSADNNAVDYGEESRAEFVFNGGTLLAVGMHGFQRQATPDGKFVIFFDQNVQEDDPIIITDADGNVIYSAMGVKYANCILYCSDELVDGETYTVSVGGVESTAVAGENQGSGEPSGEFRPGGSGEPGSRPSRPSSGEPTGEPEQPGETEPPVETAPPAETEPPVETAPPAETPEPGPSGEPSGEPTDEPSGEPTGEPTGEPVNPGETTKPAETSQPGGSNEPGGNNNNNNKNNKNNNASGENKNNNNNNNKNASNEASPKTGDTQNATLWIAMLVICGGAAVLLPRKKNSTN